MRLLFEQARIEASQHAFAYNALVQQAPHFVPEYRAEALQLLHAGLEQGMQNPKNYCQDPKAGM